MNKIFYFKKHILKFKKPDGVVSDEDIYNLFMGLVRLIKRNTEIIMEEKYLNTINKLQSQLRLKNKLRR